MVHATMPAGNRFLALRSHGQIGLAMGGLIYGIISDPTRIASNRGSEITMAKNHQDWITLVEAAYRLAGDQLAWLQNLSDSAVPLLNRGSGVAAQIVRNRPGDIQLEDVVVSGDPAMIETIRATIGSASPEAIDLTYRSGITAGTMSENVFAKVPGAAEAFWNGTGRCFRDAMGIVAYTGIGRVVALNAPLTELTAMTKRERQRWSRIAAHVGTGLRLRYRLGAADPLKDGATEAIFEPDGRPQEAREAADSRKALDVLQRAVARYESARGRLRRTDPDQALQLWQALVQGRWSLVDHMDTDDRRYIVAVRNPPGMEDPRGLTVREQQVAELLGAGRNSKETAYLLGVSTSAVNNAAARVQSKLGLRSRGELVAFFAPGGVRNTLVTLQLDGEEALIASYGGFDLGRLGPLTASEREVALLLLHGMTNQAIADSRGTSTRTVANQIQSIYRKARVSSRAELAALLN